VAVPTVLKRCKHIGGNKYVACLLPIVLL